MVLVSPVCVNAVRAPTVTRRGKEMGRQIIIGGGGRRNFPVRKAFSPSYVIIVKRRRRRSCHLSVATLSSSGFFFLLFRRLRGVGRQIGWIGPPGPIVIIVIIGSRFRRSLSGRLECRLVPCISFIFLFSSSSWPLLSSFINILASHGRPENVKKGWRIESSSLCCECPPNFSSTLETNTIAPVGVRPVSLIICRTCGSWATCTKQCHSTAYHRK